MRLGSLSSTVSSVTSLERLCRPDRGLRRGQSPHALKAYRKPARCNTRAACVSRKRPEAERGRPEVGGRRSVSGLHDEREYRRLASPQYRRTDLRPLTSDLFLLLTLPL